MPILSKVSRDYSVRAPQLRFKSDLSTSALQNVYDDDNVDTQEKCRFEACEAVKSDLQLSSSAYTRLKGVCKVPALRENAEYSS